MLVSDYMTASPVTIREDADYDAAFAIMDDQDLHHVPVVNASAQVVGIVTRRDLQLAARCFHEAPAEIAEVMHSPVLTVSSDANLSVAVSRMANDRIGCLPVCDDDEHLVGIITETDLFRALKTLLEARRD